MGILSGQRFQLLVRNKPLDSMPKTRFGYDLSRTIADIRPTYSFKETCQGSA